MDVFVEAPVGIASLIRYGAQMKPGLPLVALIASAAMFGLSVAVAQTSQPPVSPPTQPDFASPPFKNLQVFPKDITRSQLLSNMKFFAQSLGVRCSFCHTGIEGQPLSTYDFASDAKQEKRTARKMLAMAHRINLEDLAVTDFAKIKVTCFTCHRGSTHPLTEPPLGTNFVPPPPSAAPAKPAERGASQ
jgi:hypothetical protein